MRFIFTLICCSVCSQNCIAEISYVERTFKSYRISLENSSIQTSGTNELLISVFKDDLPVTKLLQSYKGVLGEFLVVDFDLDNSFKIILLFEDTLMNIRIFSLRQFELVELIIADQDLPNKNSNFLKIERKGDDIYRTLDIVDDERTYLKVQEFCFRELKWCDHIN